MKKQKSNIARNLTMLRQLNKYSQGRSKVGIRRVRTGHCKL